MQPALKLVKDRTEALPKQAPFVPALIAKIAADRKAEREAQQRQESLTRTTQDQNRPARLYSYD